MSILRAKRLVGVMVGTLIVSGALSAATISGDFNLTGNVQVTRTAFTFGLMTIGDQTASTQLPLTGTFADLVPGEVATITNLNGTANVPPGPVTPGTPFSLPNWVQLPDGINLDAQNIPVPSLPTCTAASTTSCVIFPGSPITLTPSGSVTGAFFSISGQAHTAGLSDFSSFLGVFSTQLPESIGTVISTFDSTGSFTSSYSATFVVTPTAPVPEPASMALLGAGLFGLGVLGKKKLIK